MAKRASSSPKPGRNAAASVRWDASLSSGKLTRLLLITGIVLLTCHGAVFLYHFQVSELPWLVRQLFDVDQENNLPTWFSAVLLLLSSAVLWLRSEPGSGGSARWSGHWRALAVGFLLLSLDEVAGIHETINTVIVVTWAIPALFGVLVLGLAFVPFLLALPRRTALLFLLAAVLYVTGGAGLEILGNDMVARRLRDTLQYKLVTLLEEGLEMGGVLLFLHTLLETMRARGQERVQARVEVI